MKRGNLASLVALIFVGAACAQDYPTRPVRIVDAFPPGNPGDVLARVVGDVLQRNLGQPFVVENKPGAGGNVAVQFVASASPDGYTLLTAPDTVYTVNPYLYKNNRINAQRDIVPIMRLATGNLVLACHPSVPATNLEQLIALSEARSLTYSSGGNGSPAHLATEYLKSITGLQIQHVPYRGPAQAVLAILASEVSCGLIISNSVVPLALEQRINVLLSTGAQRVAKLPNVPTAREAGVKDFEVNTFLTLSVPPKTPESVVKRLSQAFRSALQDPQVAQKLIEAEVIPAVADQAEVAKDIEVGAARWSKVIEQIGLKVD